MKMIENGSELVRYMLDRCMIRLSQKELAALLGMSPQSLNNKLFRDSFTYTEICYIAKALGFRLKLEGKMRPEIEE